jgi:hypothetical protein
LYFQADVAVGSFNLFVTAGMSDDLERQISDTQGRIDDAKLRYATANAKATAIMATLSSSVISSGVPLLCAMVSVFSLFVLNVRCMSLYVMFLIVSCLFVLFCCLCFVCL